MPLLDAVVTEETSLEVPPGMIVSATVGLLLVSAMRVSDSGATLAVDYH